MTPPKRSGRPRLRYDLHIGRQASTALLVLVAAGLTLPVAVLWSAGAPTASDVPSAARVAAAAERIDPNAASAGNLRRLHGIGPRLAGRIVAYRARWGATHARPAFSEPRDLERVDGIGPATVKRIAPYLRYPGRHRGDMSR
ncbi:MAG: helix-hairpin-helix domain-containing protein [Phycisphaerae bacterium]|nr:helix-hairpin-helix domain-containing protein [Phycisphaerae bacterium]